MGHGAAKRLTAFPTAMIVQIFAWEGLLYQSQRDLADVLKSILDGNDSPDNWIKLDEYRKQTIRYSQSYTKAILSLQINQNRG